MIWDGEGRKMFRLGIEKDISTVQWERHWKKHGGIRIIENKKGDEGNRGRTRKRKDNKKGMVE